MAKKYTTKILIEIEATLGSEFQLNSSGSTLATILEAWAKFYSASHRDNIINVKIKSK
jgi:hypothetical protein